MLRESSAAVSVVALVAILLLATPAARAQSECTESTLSGEYTGVSAGDGASTGAFSAYVFLALTANNEIAISTYQGQQGQPGLPRFVTGTYAITNAVSCQFLAFFSDGTNLVARAPQGQDFILISSAFDPNVQQAAVLFRDSF